MLARMFKRRSLSARTRFEVLKRDNSTCQYCGARAPEVALHVDHVHPVSRGGRNHLENLVTACSTCNAGKGARLLEDRSAFAGQLDLPLATPVPMRLFYIRGILRKRFDDRTFDGLKPLMALLARGFSLDVLECAAKRARDWDDFVRLVEYN
jgi:hypothetical protein